MAVNGHFASAGQNGSANFEHGVQIIDEDKEFKYGHHPQQHLPKSKVWLTSAVPILRNISPL